MAQVCSKPNCIDTRHYTIGYNASTKQFYAKTDSGDMLFGSIRDTEEEIHIEAQKWGYALREKI